MSTSIRKLSKDEYLFKEGDEPDAMYVVKSGRLQVIKSKGEGEVILAELGPGAMVGEMAFFDLKPRSASVRAVKDSEVIALPYKALLHQFASFPEWLKAIMKTVNEHLRKANQRIRELEKASGEDDVMFPPHLTNKLVSILAFVAFRYGKKDEAQEQVVILNSNILRKYTIQVFGEPTHKMNKLVEVLVTQGLAKTESTGDGGQNITLFDLAFLFEFVEWHNKYLFQKEEERATLEEKEIQILSGLLHFAKKLTPNEKGLIKLSLTQVQNDSMRELGDLIRIEQVESLIAKKLISDKVMESDGVYTFLDPKALERLVPFWQFIYALRKVTR
ncbi:MAG: cyclic nucleotide-binding domain-containing protein [Bdellovibrionaceae bacterium]|nr:cyclic nucleotide-binding domain-containing protein [Pseudobdellovibrionaceae bacterium]